MIKNWTCKKLEPEFRIRNVSFRPFPKSSQDLAIRKDGAEISALVSVFCERGGSSEALTLLAPSGHHIVLGRKGLNRNYGKKASVCALDVVVPTYTELWTRDREKRNHVAEQP